MLYSIFSKASGLARKRMFDHIQDLPVSYIEDRFSGDISSRMTTDLNDATQLFGYPTVGQYNPFSQVLSVVVLVVVLLCTNVPLGLFSILVSSLGLLVTGCLSDPIKQIERKTKETIGAATQDMVDMMAGSTMVRMYGMQKPLFRKYAEKTEHIRGLAMRSVKMRSTLGSAMELHLALCYLVVVGIGLAMASKGLVSMPAVVFIATLQSGIGESGSLRRSHYRHSAQHREIHTGKGTQLRRLRLYDLPGKGGCRVPEQGAAGHVSALHEGTGRLHEQSDPWDHAECHSGAGRGRQYPGNQPCGPLPAENGGTGSHRTACLPLSGQRGTRPVSG